MVAEPLTKSEKELPPFDPELEQKVLATLLFNSSLLSTHREAFAPELFYLSTHQDVATAILGLFDDDKPINLDSVVRRLAVQDSSVGRDVVTTISLVSVFDGWTLASDLKDLRDLATRRRLISIGQNLAAQGHILAKPLPIILESAESQVFDLSKEQQSGYQVEHISEGCERVLGFIEQGINPGIQTGFLDLDAMTRGLYRKQVFTVAAATSMGKTHFALAQALGVARQGLPVVIFSCEMSHEELTCRLLARISGIDSSRIFSGQVDHVIELPSITKAIEHLAKIPLFIYEAPNPSPAEMRSKIREASLKAGQPIALAILDYLQLLDGGGVNRVQEIDKLMRAGKAIAADFDLCWMPLAQINRNVEQRQNKRPNLSDLRESGAIEQMSNRVLFLYRDEYYDPETVDRGIIELILTKNRGGSVGSVKMLFKPETGWFGDIAGGWNEA